MSLKKKIALSFLISSFIIACLAIFEYVNFLEISKEIRQLEFTDTIRSKSLQLRRHEKNFFLYPQKAWEEAEAVHVYLDDLERSIGGGLPLDRNGALSRLEERVRKYGRTFSRIESMIGEVTVEFRKRAGLYSTYSKFFPLLEQAFYERPLQGAEFLVRELRIPPGDRLITALKELDTEIQLLRRNGEDIIVFSKELDKTARENTDAMIRVSQVAILVFFPLFFLTGIGMLFFIGRSVANRLNLLIDTAERTGKGQFSSITMGRGEAVGDEVGVLIDKFNLMEEQLARREEELIKKNAELLQTKKLAAIGTLASGVAHELNNPLNNIYLCAQTLKREMGDDIAPFIKETIGDIASQSIRVKKIVGDLLEYARGRELQFRKTDIIGLIRRAYKFVSGGMDLEGVHFVVNSDTEEFSISVDREQMERVFINLFGNSAEAMSGKGDIIVTVSVTEGSVRIWVSDTGNGIAPQDMEKIFEPFFTTKDKGTGLGLAIVYNIIKRHNGGIYVDSEKGKGTTFYITLPADGEEHAS